MYSTIIKDSHMGLPLWIKTGIFLWTGFIFKSRELLPPIKSSSFPSYSTPLAAKASLTLIPKTLGKKSNRTIWSLLAMAATHGSWSTGYIRSDFRWKEKRWCWESLFLLRLLSSGCVILIWVNLPTILRILN